MRRIHVVLVASSELVAHHVLVANSGFVKKVSIHVVTRVLAATVGLQSVVLVAPFNPQEFLVSVAIQQRMSSKQPLYDRQTSNDPYYNLTYRFLPDCRRLMEGYGAVNLAIPLL